MPARGKDRPLLRPDQQFEDLLRRAYQLLNRRRRSSRLSISGEKPPKAA